MSLYQGGRGCGFSKLGLSQGVEEQGRLGLKGCQVFFLGGFSALSLRVYVCVYVSTNVGIYIYMYIYIYIYIHIYIYTHTMKVALVPTSIPD